MTRAHDNAERQMAGILCACIKPEPHIGDSQIPCPSCRADILALVDGAPDDALGIEDGPTDGEAISVNRSASQGGAGREPAVDILRPNGAWSPNDVPQEVVRSARATLLSRLAYPHERVQNYAAIRVVVANAVRVFAATHPTPARSAGEGTGTFVQAVTSELTALNRERRDRNGTYAAGEEVASIVRKHLALLEGAQDTQTEGR